ncbi:protein EssC [Arthrobacter sp. Hiyo8]|nr:protein EssC [Arthrobacter sp. Hiyo8]
MRIATVGRSLGIHLIMATQRPQGALSADIRANVTTSIALRVQSEMESRDIINSPAAASIPVSRPGRAYMVRGGEDAEPFQSATLAGSEKARRSQRPLHCRQRGRSASAVGLKQPTQRLRGRSRRQQKPPVPLLRRSTRFGTSAGVQHPGDPLHIRFQNPFPFTIPRHSGNHGKARGKRIAGRADSLPWLGRLAGATTSCRLVLDSARPRESWTRWSSWEWSRRYL